MTSRLEAIGGRVRVNDGLGAGRGPGHHIAQLLPEDWIKSVRILNRIGPVGNSVNCSRPTPDGSVWTFK